MILPYLLTWHLETKPPVNYRGYKPKHEMTTNWDEDQILRDTIDGLSAAMDAREVGSDNLDPIKFNKLLYIAVDGLDLPVTYRWYKYGADFKFHNVDESDVQPRAISKVASPNVPRVGSAEIEEDSELPSPSDIQDFYLDRGDDFENVFRNDTKEYLRCFYQDYAPDSLVNLYTACAIFQKSLDDIGHSEAPKGKISGSIDTLLNEASELNKQVHLSDDVSDVDERYKLYSDLLKDIFVTTDDRDDVLSAREEEVLHEAIRFFYNNAWKLVAQKIALQNSSGDNSLRWRTTTARQFNSWLDTYPDDLQSLRKQCADSGLVAEEFSKFWDGRNESNDESDRIRLEAQVANKWKNASEEANQYL